MVFYLLILLFTITGCATTTHINSKRGIIKIGMTKAEVLSLWGEPYQKGFLEDEDRLGRYEIWDYPRINWWGAHTIEISFNREGVLTDIEPLYK